MGEKWKEKRIDEKPVNHVFTYCHYSDCSPFCYRLVNYLSSFTVSFLFSSPTHLHSESSSNHKTSAFAISCRAKKIVRSFIHQRLRFHQNHKNFSRLLHSFHALIIISVALWLSLKHFTKVLCPQLCHILSLRGNSMTSERRLSSEFPFSRAWWVDWQAEFSLFLCWFTRRYFQIFSAFKCFLWLSLCSLSAAPLRPTFFMKNAKMKNRVNRKRPTTISRQP